MLYALLPVCYEQNIVGKLGRFKNLDVDIESDTL